MRCTHPLVLEIGVKEISAGATVPVRVLARNSRNRPVENAVVRVGSQVQRTDEAGRCELTIRSPGFWRVTAYSPPTEQVAYEPATALLRVHSGSTTPSQLRRLGLTPA
ncbi:hypothetical protein [Natronolimnohabitans innermongolicus]|uniref:Carboxypeptidase regulatory-like domain-containing protein n=1 Tax=Natronolimnohabitans innermongolicus JCM 12255 TaxID=1227499 RepID=L9XL98_9EURY|nr:hypothetical protein [Natronolimnohabitans innermongolicus]ELY62176.1 hypothetical protein C493_00065 [Natronolimnohabitans innermongolicus JCM 12255]